VAGTAWAAVLVTGVVLDVLVDGFLGTTLRAIGRGFGSGILDFAEAFPANADNPTPSTRVVTIAVDCNAVARADLITALL
jgi:hypothetical protein